MGEEQSLSFEFRGRSVPVTYHNSLGRELAVKAVESEPFRTWCRRCSKPQGSKHIKIAGVEIQSVDMFGSRVGFVKIKSECYLVDSNTQHEHPLPGICFLRGNAVAILIALHVEDDQVYSLLVEQPRVPIGHAAALELPAGMIDTANDGIAGTAAKEIEEECGIRIKASELIDLTELGCRAAYQGGSLPEAGITPSPGGCDEFVWLLYLEKRVTREQLESMRGRLTGLKEEGEVITLRVVPFEDVWRISGDNNAMCAVFLLERLQKEGHIPPSGQLATPLGGEPYLRLRSGRPIPQMAFGLYKVPNGEEGEKIILDAIDAGYRHFDTASFYGNEDTLGKAIKKSGLKREEFFICTKVWNDAQKQGPDAVLQSARKSLELLRTNYIDLFLIHWPVPGFFEQTYKALEQLHAEGVVRSLGLSNFNPTEYQKLLDSGISVLPEVNQFEVSPAMFRADEVAFFKTAGMVVCSSKALHRGASFDRSEVKAVADKHGASAAQVFLRWGMQEDLVVVAKTAQKGRMIENRGAENLRLDDDDMASLGSLTTEADVAARRALEIERKSAM